MLGFIKQDDMNSLHQNASLKELQSYMKERCAERGWDKADILEVFLLFSEEIGELAKALRNRRRLYVEEGKQINENELPGEFADVFSYFLQLANQTGIDLSQAFLDKEEKNAKRKWS
jgi:NTP pyrophosphatase (non-canonical NTP hydrolase)